MSASRARRTRVVLDLANRQRDSERSLVVLKIGGSLFGWPGLIERIEWLLEQRPDSRCVLLCGGGQTANVVRQWQQAYGLPDEEAHWLALRAVTFNELLLHAVLPNSTIVTGEEEMFDAWQQSERPILACESFVREYEPASALPLPHNWDATSDSLAAWCARQLGANELILAKSVDLEPETSAEAATLRGLVDAHFRHVVGGITVSWTNLRSDAPTVTGWL